MRTERVSQRLNDPIRTQMYYARKGTITPEMEYVGRRERLSPSLVRDEVACGRMIIPANTHHTNQDPLCIRVNSLCKLNANSRHSSTPPNIPLVADKLPHSINDV